ncbi:transcriptional regulator [Arenicella chitinivorans]|uniref:Transcriptional regulator n=1 Tax=Arenicella chitinivorans TaxID=1329800 RepID=A0A918RSK9_9GAMM|nr:helix-turn-helix domain-containing protein [Arenicella chitinivorans]GHA09200.1 transcriptional regulator [Arenicella chitinivorans]
MEEKNKLTDDVRTMPQEGSGSLLAAARKQQNRTIEEIADELNLSVTQIRTIELDQSEGLPEPTYVRGYIRSYASLLGLDPEQVLEHYLNPNWQKGARLDDLPRGIGSASDSERSSVFSFGKLVMVAIVAGVFALWYTGKFDGLLGDQTAPVAQSVTAGPTATQPAESNTSTEIPDTTVVETSSELSEQAQTTSPLNQTADEVIAANESLEDESLQQRVGQVLVLDFNDTCWVDIRDSDGKRLAYKSYAGGEQLEVQSELPITVFLGKAAAVTAKVNGDDFDLTPHREGVFARFSIGE